MRPVHVEHTSHKGVVFVLTVRLAIGAPQTILARSSWDHNGRAPTMNQDRKSCSKPQRHAVVALWPTWKAVGWPS